MHSEAAAYLNLKIGEIIHHFGPEYSDEDENPDLEERPDDFLRIAPLDSHDGFQIMESFVDNLKEGETKRALTRDLSRPKTFRNFKDTLLEFPDLREAYFTHENKEQEKAALRFLKSHKIQAN